MSYTINSGVGQWDKSADLEWRLKQMQDDIKFLWSRLTDLEEARDEKIEPDAREPANRYFVDCLKENAKLIEENDVLRYQYEAMKNETARCKSQLDQFEKIVADMQKVLEMTMDQRDEYGKTLIRLKNENQRLDKTMHEETVRCKEQIEKLRNSAECQGSTIQSLYEQRDELLIENKKLKEDLTKKYEGEKAAALNLEESSTYWQQKYNKQLQETDFLNKKLDFFEKMSYDLELEKNDAKWYKEQAIEKFIDIVERIKNDPNRQPLGPHRYTVAICEDIKKAIKNEFGVK